MPRTAEGVTAAAVEGLPDLDTGPAVAGQAALRTGTNAMPVQAEGNSIALNRVSECLEGPICGYLGASGQRLSRGASD